MRTIGCDLMEVARAEQTRKYRELADCSEALIDDVFAQANAYPPTFARSFELEGIRKSFFTALDSAKTDGSFGRFLETHFETGKALLSETPDSRHTSLLADFIHHNVTLNADFGHRFGKRDAIQCIALLGFAKNIERKKK